MNVFDFSAIFLPHCQYRITKQMRQHWRETSFSYVDRPRPDHGLLMVAQGHILFAFGKERLLAEPGDVLFIPEGSRYEAQIPPEFGDAQDYLINFEATLPLPKDIPLAPIKLLHTQSNAIAERFLGMIQWPLPQQDSKFCRLGKFLFLLDGLLEAIQDDGRRGIQSVLKQAEELLTGREELSVREIAARCGISESGLRRHFTRACGLSPQQYRMQVRIDRAKFLLEATDLSLTEIAEQCGFYDMPYFCKLFRRHVGCSPRKYVAARAI